MESLRKSLESIKAMWSALSASQKAAVGVLALAVGIAGAWGSATAGSAGERRLVGPETNAADQVEILRQLEQEGIPHRVSGGAIYVPADRADEAWVKVQGATNIEIKESPFAAKETRDRQWQLRTQAAMERMIARMDGIKSAAVQLTPSKEGWSRDKTQGSAAVMVELKPGANLGRGKALDIARLVAGGTGIKAENVIVTSPAGSFTGGDADLASASDFQDQALAMSAKISERVQQLLGFEARVMATVKLNAKSTVVTEELFTPGPIKEEDAQKRIQYENSRKEIRESTPKGALIESMSVAVVIPVSERSTTIPAEGTARDEYRGKIERVVGNATGIQQPNNIAVEFIPMAAPPVAAISAWADAWDSVKRNVGHALLVLLALMLAYGAWRVVRTSMERTSSVTVEESARPALAGVSSNETDAGRLRAGVSDAALRDPREAADTVRKMMER